MPGPEPRPVPRRTDAWRPMAVILALTAIAITALGLIHLAAQQLF